MLASDVETRDGKAVNLCHQLKDEKSNHR